MCDNEYPHTRTVCILTITEDAVSLIKELRFKAHVEAHLPVCIERAAFTCLRFRSDHLRKTKKQLYTQGSHQVVANGTTRFFML